VNFDVNKIPYGGCFYCKHFLITCKYSINEYCRDCVSDDPNTKFTPLGINEYNGYTFMH
jgi:hypothetical protein